MKSTKIIVIGWLVLAEFLIFDVARVVRAQNPPTQSWLLWSGKFFADSAETARVYKIQDGSCSLYVVLGYPGNTAPVAIATGQGCQSYPTIQLQQPNNITPVINTPTPYVVNPARR